ncbi:MAG: GNAT family N-acetyltransferase [Planctomycetaceae bacterium]|nr:GNAT family N-acetyltransferase [Planctomycetaceae bacterium]
MTSFIIRTMTADDRHEVAELIYISINHWYMKNGRPEIFRGGPEVTEVFFDVYEALDPGCGIVAENSSTGRLTGSCFYHPRSHHVSLGIMNVHPNYFGSGAGKALLDYIINYSKRAGRPLRLTQSAINLDSFSLYNKAGFVPRHAYQDMFLSVPETGFPAQVVGRDRVRDATPSDVAGMAELEMSVSRITREQDYEFCITNNSGDWHTSVYEDQSGEIAGFMISCSHPAMNMLGPCVARGEVEAIALLANELNVHAGRTPVFLIPVECEQMVRQAYDWAARNCELHFCQVLGDFHPFQGVNMPSFLPETG